jgi:primosomal replication protein N
VRLQRKASCQNRTVAISISLNGRLTRAPELRVTPAGTAVLRLLVDCGETDGQIVMGVQMVGEKTRELVSRLRAGSEIRARGALQVLLNRRALDGIEIVADEIALAADAK